MKATYAIAEQYESMNVFTKHSLMYKVLKWVMEGGTGGGGVVVELVERIVIPHLMWLISLPVWLASTSVINTTEEDRSCFFDDVQLGIEWSTKAFQDHDGKKDTREVTLQLHLQEREKKWIPKYQQSIGL